MLPSGGHRNAADLELVEDVLGSSPPHHQASASSCAASASSNVGGGGASSRTGKPGGVADRRRLPRGQAYAELTEDAPSPGGTDGPTARRRAWPSRRRRCASRARVATHDEQRQRTPARCRAIGRSGRSSDRWTLLPGSLFPQEHSRRGAARNQAVPTTALSSAVDTDQGARALPPSLGTAPRETMTKPECTASARRGPRSTFR
jgi:hypothetical protein